MVCLFHRVWTSSQLLKFHYITSGGNLAHKAVNTYCICALTLNNCVNKNNFYIMYDKLNVWWAGGMQDDFFHPRGRENISSDNFSINGTWLLLPILVLAWIFSLVRSCILSLRT
jgi:hypothetical protein